MDGWMLPYRRLDAWMQLIPRAAVDRDQGQASRPGKQGPLGLKGEDDYESQPATLHGGFCQPHMHMIFILI